MSLTDGKVIAAEVQSAFFSEGQNNAAAVIADKIIFPTFAKVCSFRLKTVRTDRLQRRLVDRQWLHK